MHAVGRQDDGCVIALAAYAHSMEEMYTERTGPGREGGRGRAGEGRSEREKRVVNTRTGGQEREEGEAKQDLNTKTLSCRVYSA